MGIYTLHKLIFDIASHANLRQTFLSDPEAVYSQYQLNDEELAALRVYKDIYGLPKLGVVAFLLAPFARLLGFKEMNLSELLRAGAKAEQQGQS